MKNILTLIFFVTSIISCKNQKQEAKIMPPPTIKKEIAIQQPIKGLKYLKSYCYACHNPKSEENNLLAPPLIDVKKTYKAKFTTKQEFIEAVSNWVINADEMNGLMADAIKKYNVMPKMPFPKSHLEELASYMYDNELEKPIWHKK